MTAVRLIVILLWLLLGLYVGIAGWLACKALENTTISQQPSVETGVVYHGIQFQSESELNGFLREESEAQWSPWLYNLPQALWPLIGCLGFGLLGATGRLLKNCVVDKSSPDVLALISTPLFGALLGTLLFYMLYLVPTVLVVGGDRVRATSLAALSLFGGLFSEHTYAWFERQYKDVLSKLGRQ